MIKLLIFILIVFFAVIGFGYILTRLLFNYTLKSKGFKYWPKDDREMRFIEEKSLRIIKILNELNLNQKVYALQRIIATFELKFKFKITDIKHEFKFGKDKEVQKLYEKLWYNKKK